MKKVLITLSLFFSFIIIININTVFGANEIEAGTYEIYTSVSDTKVVEISNKSTANKANVDIYERINNNSQKFRFEPNADGTYTIIATHSNKVLDVQEAGMTNGTNVWQYEANGSNAQKWYLKPCGNNTYNIVSKLNGLYLDIYGGKNANGQNIQVYTGNGSIAQKFKITKLYNTGGEKTIEDGVYKIHSKVAENRVLEVPNSSLNNQTVIKTATNNNKANQKFRITYNGDGTYSIIATHSKKAMDVKAAEGKNGTPVQQYDSNKTVAQKWIILKNSDNTYSIISKCNGLALDIYAASTATGTNLQTYKLNGSKAQKFTFEENKPDQGTQSVEDGTYRILSVANSKKVFDITGGSDSNGANVQIWDSSKVTQQKFILEYDGNGYYKIKSKKSNKVLTVESEKPKVGSNVTQQEDKNLDTQKWILKRYSESVYAIISKCGNLYMEIGNSNASNGTKILLRDQTDLNLQQFILVNETPKTNISQVNDGIYQIEVKGGKVLDITGGSQNNFANLQIYTNAKVQQQKFRVTRIGDTNYYKIISINSAKSLDVYAGLDTPGTNVDQYTANDTDSQYWCLKSTGDGYYNIISKVNGLCLDVYGGNVNNNGTNVQMYYINNSNAQKFKFTPINIINNNTYEIETKLNSNKVVDISGGSTQNAANAQIWDADNVNQQRFIFEALSTDTYKITAKHSNKALTVASNNNVYQATYAGDIEQQWKIVEQGAGYYNLISKANGLALDIYAGIANNGQNIATYKPNGTDAQKFKFVTGYRKFIQEGTYGSSGLAYAGDKRGTKLKYYKIGKGKKVFFAAFSIHGFEDSYAHDGAELTYIAEQFKNYLYNNIDEATVNNWTIYILPNLNPDGQTHGYSHNGPGRTTLYSEAPAHKGIDMNRNWSVGYTRSKNDRNYNGTAPFQAYEAKALREFILNRQGESNILVDTHGWLNETIGDNALGSYYRSQYGLPTHIGTYGQGYLVNWARTIKNGRSVLVELPEVKNHNQVISWGYASKYINATMKMLREN